MPDNVFPFQQQMISGLGLCSNRCSQAALQQAFRSDGLVILVVYTVTHATQTAGGLVRENLWHPPGGGRIDSGSWCPPTSGSQL